MSDEPKELFYVQDARSVVGNCMVWWAPNGNGYTCDLRHAGKFTREELPDRPTDIAWPVGYIDARGVWHVDAQQCDRKLGLPGGKDAAGV